jgi:UDP-N-acetylmuramate dehydrogenase
MDKKENVSLKSYNTFHVDVKASEFIEIYSEEELIELCRHHLRGRNYFILGGGSNILLLNDLELVVKISIPGISIINEDDSAVYIRIGAGVNWDEVVTYSLDRNLGGIENLVLIPGTTGAAPMQNIGAYGQELKDTFHWLQAVDINEASSRSFSKEECRFGYRSSIFKQELKDKYIITSVTLRLRKDPLPEVSYSSVKAIIVKEALKEYSIHDISRIIADIRRSKLPDPAVTGNAGSFFKNPEVDQEVYEKIKEQYPAIAAFRSENEKIKIAAGWLIEASGWKGKREGDAGSHKDQALVIVNYGGASGKDILNFTGKVKTTVYEKFGILLEEEVNLVK